MALRRTVARGWSLVICSGAWTRLAEARSRGSDALVRAVFIAMVNTARSVSAGLGSDGVGHHTARHLAMRRQGAALRLVLIWYCCWLVGDLQPANLIAGYDKVVNGEWLGLLALQPDRKAWTHEGELPILKG